MASQSGGQWKGSLRGLLPVLFSLVWALVLASAESEGDVEISQRDYVLQRFFWPPPRSKYQHVWPTLEIGWRGILGSVIGFTGAVLGSVGGAGGGAIFVPMLTIVIGFDVKSSTALSKCMITGIAGATVFYKLKKTHPTLNVPVIDYDLALLFQPMLLLGISIGVYLNVIFAEWMIILVLVILSLGTASRAFYNGFDTWKKESFLLRETSPADLSDDGDLEGTSKPLLHASSSDDQKEIKILTREDNIRWMELGLLIFVWFSFLVIQIIKADSATCSTRYWLLNLLQIPIAVGVTLFESVNLYKGKRVIVSNGKRGMDWSAQQLVIYCMCGILAGVVGGLLGLGGSFILAPLFSELGIPSQVASATATFVIAFSSPLSVVEYYFLKRFPVSYALYFVMVAIVAALVGQHLVKRLVVLLQRASHIIFILASLISISAISLGVYGAINLVHSIKHGDYIGFEDRCIY